MSEKNETLVAMLVKQVALPKKANLIRIAGAGNARPTALANPFAKPPMNWSTPPAAVLQVLPGDEAIMIVTNDPLCAMIFTDKNPAAVALSQAWVVSGSPDTFVFTLAPGQETTLEQDLYCAVPAVGSRQFHGPRIYARKFKGRYYMWCDAPTTAQAGNAITVSTSSIAMAATDSITITLYRLNEGDEIQFVSVVVPGPIAANTTVLSTNIFPADYWRVRIAADDDNTTAVLNFVISNSANCEIECHLALPDLTERQMNIVQGIRVFGAASHAINLVSDQNATGSWVGDQPEGSIVWTSYLRGISGNNGFQKLAGSQGNEIMELKKFNPYTFVTPEDQDDWQFVHPFTFNATSSVTNVLNRTMEEFHYTVTYFKSGGATPLAPDLSRNLQLEFFFSVEYTSDALWPQYGVSPASEDDTAAAVKVLASMENITHNPGFAEIMKTIGKYVRLSAPVLSMLGPYGKAAGIAAAGVGAGLKSIGYRTKKTARQEDDKDGDGSIIKVSQKVARLAPEAME